MAVLPSICKKCICWEKMHLCSDSKMCFYLQTMNMTSFHFQMIKFIENKTIQLINTWRLSINLTTLKYFPCFFLFSRGSPMYKITYRGDVLLMLNICWDGQAWQNSRSYYSTRFEIDAPWTFFIIFVQTLYLIFFFW